MNNKPKGKNAIIIGGGLAGLSCAAELAAQGVHVRLFEANPYLGGRTASWNDDGMAVESGLHRYLGFYTNMPRLLKKVGLDLNKLFYWEDEIVILLKGGKSGVFGLAPLFKPIGTLKSVFGNSHIFSFKDKLSILRLMACGIADCMLNRKKLDGLTILDYAKKKGISAKVITRLISPLSSGLFFLPPERYSAFVFFGLFLPHLHKSLITRVGAFRGGMTEVMANPIAKYITGNGGEIFISATAEQLITGFGRVAGVVVNGETYFADHVVLATSLYPAQQIISRSFANHRWFQPMLKLQTMPSVTIQIELTERCMPKDRTTFAPETCLASFSEQTQSTFTHLPGRLSIILTPPEKFLKMKKEEILEQVCNDLDSLNIRIRDKIIRYRIVTEPREFYALTPGAEAMKPRQKTPVKGFYLAGDYTRQRYLATMEGAVYSGYLVAKSILKR